MHHNRLVAVFCCNAAGAIHKWGPRGNADERRSGCRGAVLHRPHRGLCGRRRVGPPDAAGRARRGEAHARVAARGRSTRSFPRNNGHLLQRLGDGLMLDFSHPRDAAACARALHQRCADLSANLPARRPRVAANRHSRRRHTHRRRCVLRPRGQRGGAPRRARRARRDGHLGGCTRCADSGPRRGDRGPRKLPPQEHRGAAARVSARAAQRARGGPRRSDATAPYARRHSARASSRRTGISRRRRDHRRRSDRRVVASARAARRVAPFDDCVSRTQAAARRRPRLSRRHLRALRRISRVGRGHHRQCRACRHAEQRGDVGEELPRPDRAASSRRTTSS